MDDNGLICFYVVRSVGICLLFAQKRNNVDHEISLIALVVCHTFVVALWLPPPFLFSISLAIYYFLLLLLRLRLVPPLQTSHCGVALLLSSDALHPPRAKETVVYLFIGLFTPPLWHSPRGSFFTHLSSSPTNIIVPIVSVPFTLEVTYHTSSPCLSVVNEPSRSSSQIRIKNQKQNEQTNRTKRIRKSIH